MRIHKESGAGRTVVLVHGAAGDGSHWDDVLALKPEGVRAVAIDIPDFGYDEPGTTFASVEASFVDFVESLDSDGPVTLAGNSFGAWLVARSLPALGQRVRRAVLLAGFPRAASEIASAYTGLATGIETGAVDRETSLRGALQGALGADGTPELLARVAAIAARYPDERLIRSLRLIASLDSDEAEVAPYSVPATCVHARDDAAVPLEQGRQLAALGAHASFEEWDGDSHFLPVTAPERVAALVYA